MDGVAVVRLRDLGGLDRARRNGTRAMTIIIGYRCRDRAIQQRAGAVGIDRHFRNGMLQRLKFGKRPPELLANAQVSCGLPDRLIHAADQIRAQTDRGLIDRHLQRGYRVIGISQWRRHLDRVELKIGNGTSIERFVTAALHAAGGGVDDEKQRTRLSIGARRHEHTIRSEEHTSELQSLMRISYAVFCLKKKNNNNTTATKE